jgi:lambda repressor-like predicted transcriptional regulator
MALDPELLKKAQTAGARLVEAERQATEARGDYYTMIRRMHLAGASLRVLAEALDLSHQRVQQIVAAAGGSWWQKIWRTRNPQPGAVCTFCGRPPLEVSKLLAGPNVFICDTCVASGQQAISGATPDAGWSVSQVIKSRCSFCTRRAGAQRSVARAAGASICHECIGLCNRIMQDRVA